MKMKGIRGTNNAVIAFWQRTLLDAKIITLAKQYRKEIGIPVNGFRSLDGYDEWHAMMEKESGSDQARKENFHEFANEAKRIIPYRGVLNELHFKLILIDFYYFNEADKERLTGAEYSEFGVHIVRDGKENLSSKTTLAEGVYIKIAPDAGISRIQYYIESHRPIIRSAQKIFIGTAGVEIAKKPKLHSNFKRDSIIVDLNSKTSKYLKTLGGDGSSKEGLIADIMQNQLGYENVKAEVVKTVIQRRRKMTKTLSGE